MTKQVILLIRCQRQSWTTVASTGRDWCLGAMSQGLLGDQPMDSGGPAKPPERRPARCPLLMRAGVQAATINYPTLTPTWARHWLISSLPKTPDGLGK
jgi:hypothetical protein